ncbi:MAG TPA: hypothetical protein VEL07_12670 [Planctomycetota bacterium]|nr:hypothetical protein [Planctomycetota bacterium]
MPAPSVCRRIALQIARRSRRAALSGTIAAPSTLTSLDWSMINVPFRSFLD